MKKELSHPTPRMRSKRAAVYLEAARQIAEREEVFSCCAVGNAETGDRASAHMINSVFMQLPHVASYNDIMDSPCVYDMDGNHHRVVALCFMAAMAQAGDA